MSVKNWLLIVALTSLVGSVAFAQNPSPMNLGPADGHADYADNADKYSRVDKITTPEANVVYQTEGTTMPYYVAPSKQTHPTLDHTKVKFNAADIKSTWEWIADPASTDLIFSASVPPEANKQMIKVDKATAGVTIKVLEKSACDGIASYFKIIGTGKPNLMVQSANIDGTALNGAADTYAGADIAALNGASGFLIQTCDKTQVDGKTLKINLKSIEEFLPEDSPYRKYSFSIKQETWKSVGGTLSQVGATANAVEYKLKKSSPVATDGKLTVSGSNAGTTIDITLPATNFTNEEFFDYVYYLSGSDTRTGVVSAISHHSDYQEPEVEPGTITDYPYTKAPTNGFYVIVRVSTAPKTGPIYFIPYLAD